MLFFFNFEQSLNTLIEKELIQKISNKGVSLNIKKKGEISSYLQCGTRTCKIEIDPYNDKLQVTGYSMNPL